MSFNASECFLKVKLAQLIPINALLGDFWCYSRLLELKPASKILLLTVDMILKYGLTNTTKPPNIQFTLM